MTASTPLLEQADTQAAGPHPASAVPLYRELLAAEPTHVNARLHLAQLLDRLEEREAALTLLDDALRQSADQTEFLVLRGEIYGHLRRFDEAEADLRRALRLHPSHGRAHLELGRVLFRKGLADEASEHFRQAVEFQPDNARAHASLGDALNQAGDLAGARTVLERAVQLDPQDAKAHHLLGRVYDRLGHPDEARAMYQRSRELTGA
jgi:tetratricopeptide (TPR) repeat protein